MTPEQTGPGTTQQASANPLGAHAATAPEAPIGQHAAALGDSAASPAVSEPTIAPTPHTAPNPAQPSSAPQTVPGFLAEQAAWAAPISAEAPARNTTDTQAQPATPVVMVPVPAHATAATTQHEVAESASVAAAQAAATPAPDSTGDLIAAAQAAAAHAAAAEAGPTGTAAAPGAAHMAETGAAPTTETVAAQDSPDVTVNDPELSSEAETSVDAAAADAAAVAEPAGTDMPDELAPLTTEEVIAADTVSPSDTAEIDVDAVEAKLNDPGSTMSFEPLPAEERIETDSTYDAGTSMSLMWGARSDVGCVRPHNEDSYLVQPPLFCVCDGMGGHAAGEVASSIAVETIAKTAPHEADPARLAAAVEAANAAIIEAAANGLGKPGMGCTATAAYVEDNTIAIAHVGDSRAYLLHEGTLIRVTRDHSYVEELVDAGEITADEARVHPNRSVITRALGSDPAMYADHFAVAVEEGDRLILCSDGLSSMITDYDIENIATQSSTAQVCVDNLVDAALAAGGADNVSVIAVDIVDDGKIRKLSDERRRIAIISATALVAALLLVGIIAFETVKNSVYLGTKGGYVAVYTGTKGSFMGIELNSLEHKTTIELSDLPEDTQRRLREGIPQSSIDDANETIENYRKQIVEEQTQQVADGQTIRESTDEDSDSTDDASDTGADEIDAADAQSLNTSADTAQGGDQ